MFDNGYLAALRQSNVSLDNGNEISAIVPRGIIMKDGMSVAQAPASYVLELNADASKEILQISMLSYARLDLT